MYNYYVLINLFPFFSSGQIDGHKMLTCKSNSNKRSVRFIDGLSWFKGFAILVHAIRINIHNKASKEREWTSKFQFKFKHRELMCTFRWSSTNLYLRISIPLGRLIVFNFDRCRLRWSKSGRRWWWPAIWISPISQTLYRT